MRRFLAALGVAALAATLSASSPQGLDARHRPHPRPHPTPGSTLTATPTPAPTSTPAPTASSQPAYTFDDEFSGPSLSPAWHQNFHCCGVTAMDPSLTTVSGGYLHQAVVDRSGTWYGDIVATGFQQAYGLFEARVKVPEGVGLWPAFWLYGGSGTPEVDAVEVCANPPDGGNDATVDHTTLHFADGTQAGHDYRSVDLSLAFHDYAVDWRPGSAKFYLDGQLAWSYSGANVPSNPMSVLLDLGLGGSWCGNPTSATPASSEMLVDWVRVSR